MSERIDFDCLSLSEIEKRLASNHLLEDQSGSYPGFQQAAILMLLVCDQGQLQFLYTQRSTNVRDHKGQVAFPGGAREPGDSSILQTALRETHEEIGVLPADVKIFGSMSPVKTISNYIITPFIGSITWPYPLKPSKDEVDHVFMIPLNWLQNDSNHEERWVDLPDLTVRRKAIYYQLYQGQLLWGITAALTLEVLDRIKNPPG